MGHSRYLWAKCMNMPRHDSAAMRPLSGSAQVIESPKNAASTTSTMKIANAYPALATILAKISWTPRSGVSAPRGVVYSSAKSRLAGIVPPRVSFLLLMNGM